MAGVNHIHKVVWNMQGTYILNLNNRRHMAVHMVSRHCNHGCINKLKYTYACINTFHTQEHMSIPLNWVFVKIIFLSFLGNTSSNIAAIEIILYHTWNELKSIQPPLYFGQSSTYVCIWTMQDMSRGQFWLPLWTISAWWELGANQLAVGAVSCSKDSRRADRGGR